MKRKQCPYYKSPCLGKDCASFHIDMKHPYWTEFFCKALAPHTLNGFRLETCRPDELELYGVSNRIIVEAEQ